MALSLGLEKKFHMKRDVNFSVLLLFITVY